MARIMTIGEILVEIMATERGQSFRAPGTLVGPFPSGAPAIFIDQVGRLGRAAGWAFGGMKDGECHRHGD
jgi:hypothetical protein